MSPAQFAFIVGAESKWIQNANRVLGRTTRVRPTDARWFGLMHALHAGLTCTLREAARFADIALATGLDERWLRIDVGDTKRAVLVIDLWRNHSIFLARLSYATTNPVGERRGRPPAPRTRRTTIARAIAYGVDVSRLRAGLVRTPEERLARLDDNAAFLAAGRAALARKRAAT